VRLSVDDIARMMDISAVRTDVCPAEVEQMAGEAKKYNCIIAYVMPCYIEQLRGLLADAAEVGPGAPVGFPSGAQTTAVKVAEAKELVALGTVELDMVANVGWLKSGRCDDVEEDIRRVVEAVEGTPVKVILECHYLDDEQMRAGCEASIRAKAAFVKTGTGWAPSGATLHNISLLKSVAGEDIRVKASGGVRDVETLAEMYRRGATRFGVGWKAAAKLIEQCAALPGGAIEV